MAVTGVFSALAARAPVPVFVLQGCGDGPEGDAEQLRLHPRVDVVTSPRHATVLVVAGRLPAALHAAASMVHDALPHPRATVRWGDGADGWAAATDGHHVAGTADAVADAVSAVHRSLIAGGRTSEPAWGAPTSREPWRGEGPYGHGGTGMTGGVPYGRPLADRADDLRDGLKLDALPIVVGPFFPPFPVGLTLDVVLQGDLVQHVEVRANPFAADAAATAAVPDVFTRAAEAAVAVAEIETARARHHLRVLAHTVRLLDLDAVARRVLRAATAPAPAMAARVGPVLRLLRRVPIERMLPPVGVFDGTDVPGHGFAARAAGRPVDARTEDPAYEGLGFSPVVTSGGDVRSRWRQRLAEVEHAMSLARVAGDRLRAPADLVEHPGEVVEDVVSALPDMLVGLEWGDAVAVVRSFGIDLRHPVTARAAA